MYELFILQDCFDISGLFCRLFFLVLGKLFLLNLSAKCEKRLKRLTTANLQFTQVSWRLQEISCVTRAGEAAFCYLLRSFLCLATKCSCAHDLINVTRKEPSRSQRPRTFFSAKRVQNCNNKKADTTMQIPRNGWYITHAHSYITRVTGSGCTL